MSKKHSPGDNAGGQQHEMNKRAEKFQDHACGRDGHGRKPRPAQMKYYDLKKNWRKVKSHLDNKELNDILIRDFNKFTYGRWRKPFTAGHFPTEFESCDWQLRHRGKRPAFWKYTKHAASHWLVNFTWRLAMLVEPDRPWRIITSERHSTVWDGAETLFDFNFQALGITPAECFERAFETELKPGEYLRVYFAAHYTKGDDCWVS
jgi:hypothetical protein